MNIIIGVGGTGAKVVEAVINFSLMGIGPTSLDVGFVDQDDSNGNLHRARTVFEDYQAARASWRGNAVHRIDGVDECALMKTSLQALDGNDGMWIPDDRAGATLAGLLGPMKEDKFLFDALFETGIDEDTEEQKLDLGAGYRGRPHIGAAAMTVKSEERNRFWDAITEAIQNAGMAGNVRILIAGSVFGGTGAAGFPTIARIIRSRLADAGIVNNVEIGGVLMLPYFGFPDPTEDQDQNVARAHEQEMQAKGALLHYQHMLSGAANEGGQHIFDQLYLIGWNPFFSIDVHSKGAGSQRNPALLPEFLAASAAARFFTSERLPDEEVAQQIIVSARRDLASVAWPDLPAISTADADRRSLHESVARFLRFAVAFKFWKPQIGDPARRKGVQGQKWYKTQKLNAVDWTTDSPSEALNNLEKAVDNALAWFASMDAYSRRNADHTFALWRVGLPLVEEIDFARLDRDPRVAGELSDTHFARLYNSIVEKFAPNDDNMPTHVDLSDYLTDFEVEREHEKMGRFIAALYNFSDVRPIAANA